MNTTSVEQGARFLLANYRVPQYPLDSTAGSYKFWQRRFHGDPAAVGQRLKIGRFSYPIVGIMPASFQFPKS